MVNWSANTKNTNYLKVKEPNVISVFSFVLFSLFCLSLQAQQVIGVQYQIIQNIDSLISYDIQQFRQDQLLSIEPGKQKANFQQSVMMPQWEPKHHGVFCRIEEQIEIKSKIPVRFRLGTLDYVNQLEQKFTPYQVKIKDP